MDNREAGRYNLDIRTHPPVCTCKACLTHRLNGEKRYIDYVFDYRAEIKNKPDTRQIKNLVKYNGDTYKRKTNTRGLLYIVISLFAVGIILGGLYLLFNNMAI